MSEETNKDPEIVEGKTTPSMDIRAEVTRRVKTESGNKVRQNIIDALYEAEEKRRTDAVMNIFTQIEAKNKDLAGKSHPDQKFYDSDGKEKYAVFSKGRVDEIKKLKEEIAKLESKLILAFEKNDWSKVLGG